MTYPSHPQYLEYLEFWSDPCWTTSQVENYTDQDGTTHWKLNGQYHREDGPAMVIEDGTQFWFRYGQLHRLDGPAVLWPEGSYEYHVYGQLHREDGPAAWYQTAEGHVFCEEYYEYGELEHKAV
jgi:hypothetical protein